MKKVLSLLLALTLVFALVACNNEKDTASEHNTSATTQIETESADNTEPTDSNTTDENSSDTETPSSSTSTLTTSKPTTSSKPSNTTSKITTNSQNNSTSNKPSNSSSDDKNTISDWKYYNGGDNYIIKTNGVQEEKIYISGNFSETIASGTWDSENGKQLREIRRENITPYNEWIFYSEYYVDTFIYKETQEKESYIVEIGFYKMKEDGTQRTIIGWSGATESREPEFRDLIGAKGEYLYFFIFDGGQGRSEENELNLCRIPMNSKSTDFAKDCEFIAYIESGLYIETSKSYIDGDWIYFQSTNSKYKINIDGTQEQKLR